MIQYVVIFLQRFGQPAQVAQPSTQLSPAERDKVYNCILELSSMKTREHALVELRFVKAQMFFQMNMDLQGEVGNLSLCTIVQQVALIAQIFNWGYPLLYQSNY